MGYYVAKRTRKDGTIGWRLLHNSWIKGVRVQRHIKPDEMRDLGFQPEMTLEQAKEIQTRLNATTHLKNWDRRRSIIQNNLNKEKKAKVAFLPRLLVEDFLKSYRDRFDIQDPKEIGRANSHWRAIEKLTKELKKGPSEFSKNPEILYQYLKNKAWSLSHIRKILRMYNLWGRHYCLETNKVFIEIDMPTGKMRTSIVKAYKERIKTQQILEKESYPLSPEMLEAAKDKLEERHYNWHYISIMFGLRPDEVDQLRTDPTSWKITIDEGVKCLDVRQDKLKNLPEDKQWKLIPILFPEQELALAIIRSGNFKRPLTKTSRKIHPGVTPYGGRKYFEYMMIELKGYSIETVGSWMGHQNINTLWTKYRNRRKVRLK